jgi:hypothetical protein
MQTMTQIFLKIICYVFYCMQYISNNLYKTCPNQDIKDLFKWTTLKKKPHRFKEGMLSIR